ncbi:MAG: hypothetical protein V3U31_08450 [Dehalococcoidia bacterium]
MAKIAVLMFSDASQANLARGFHALLLTKQFHQGGIEVRLIFDGAGTGWITALSDPEHRLHGLFNEVKGLGLVGGVCHYCSGRYSDPALVEKEGLALLGEAEGHPDIARLVKEGYQLLTL